MKHNRLCDFYEKYQFEKIDGANGTIFASTSVYESERCNCKELPKQITFDCDSCLYFQLLPKLTSLQQNLKTTRIRQDGHIANVLSEVFLGADYPKTGLGALKFQNDLEENMPNINSLVLSPEDLKNGRGIREIVMDKLEIAG